MLVWSLLRTVLMNPSCNGLGGWHYKWQSSSDYVTGRGGALPQLFEESCDGPNGNHPVHVPMSLRARTSALDLWLLLKRSWKVNVRLWLGDLEWRATSIYGVLWILARYLCNIFPSECLSLTATCCVDPWVSSLFSYHLLCLGGTALGSYLHVNNSVFL